MTTRLRVAVKNGDKSVTIMTAEHGGQAYDCMRQGPTVGPFTVSDGAVLFWPSGRLVGEPVPIRAGQQLVVTCEIDP